MPDGALPENADQATPPSLDSPRVDESDNARDLQSDLRFSLADGGFFGLMVGMGETYLPAFALALGMDELIAGLVATVPIVCGAMLQMAAPKGLRLVGSYRRWVVGCALVQATSFVPLVLAAWSGAMPVWLLFAVATIYWAHGLATGPAWNTWIGTLIPYRLRAQHFALRSRLNQGAVLIGFVTAGVSLHVGKKEQATLLAFAALFFTAWLCRLASCYCLWRQSEPEPPDHEDRDVPIREVLSRIRHGSDGRLLVYMLAVQVGLQVAGPYFTPFMLKADKLNLSYLEYCLLIGCSFVAKVTALPLWGRYAHRLGARRLLWIGGIGIVPMAFMWTVSANIWYLALVQWLSGMAWAAYELATALLFFEAIQPEERTSVLTTFNLGNSLAMVFGSLIGAGILRFGGETAGAYLVVFAVSSVMRLMTLALLGRAATPVQGPVILGTRTMSVRPEDGNMVRPIHPGPSARGE